MFGACRAGRHFSCHPARLRRTQKCAQENKNAQDNSVGCILMHRSAARVLVRRSALLLYLTVTSRGRNWPVQIVRPSGSFTRVTLHV